MSAPDWKEVLPTPLAGARLMEAWFTTYDKPDTGLLVEHLLPSLLGANHPLSQEPQDRTLFFGELGTVLESLHGRLTVISSPLLREQRSSSQYPWLWRYVSHFTVGAKSRAVQHAKLWAFHWNTDDGDQLELHISSTNLTTSAFKGQVQAGWNTFVPLQENPTKTRQRGWGELIPFLDALGSSAGDNAKNRIDRLIQLLGKAECPEGVTFVSSMPGSNKRAAQMLKKLGPSAIHILTPTIGDWSKDTLVAWSKDVGISPKKIHLKWLDVDHHWASGGGWTLTEQARNALQDKGVQLNHLPPDARFSNMHADGDKRWSHAKLYLLRIPNKKYRYLLVTSANWSPSAWGAGSKEPPRNFELGVAFETDWKMLEAISSDLFAPYYTERSRTGDSNLQWAEATWDGKCIDLRARSSDSSTPIIVTISFIGGLEEVLAIVDCAAAMPWKDPERTPLTAWFAQDNEMLEVDVLDLRPPAAFAKTPLPEVDPTLAKELRAAFLLQRYGGPVVEIPGPTPAPPTARRPSGGGTPVADYSVQAWTDARAAFEVVDNWRAALVAAKGDPAQLERVRVDGEELCALYSGRQGAAAAVVAEEFGWRLHEENDGRL